MHLAEIDWIIIGAFMATVILIGLIVSRTSGKSSSEFFVGGRSMPWWLLGVSSQNNPPIIATEFAAKGKVKVLKFQLTCVFFTIHP